MAEEANDVFTDVVVGMSIAAGVTFVRSSNPAILGWYWGGFSVFVGFRSVLRKWSDLRGLICKTLLVS